MSMAASPVRTILRVALVPLCLCIATASANAQADRCGTLAEVLKFGVDETDVASTQREARRLYQFACDEQSRVRQRNSSTSINASYALFSAGAKNNSSSIDDYREKHCSLSENDVASFATDSFRQRSVNPEAVDAWSACIGNQTGILLDPRLDPNQKVASFSITYDARRFAAVPTLRGISSETFACQTAGKGDPIGVGGEPLAISPTEALVIRCDRDSDTSAIEGRPVTVYREDSMILDLSTGGHRIDFAERREGPVAEEFAQLQDRVRSLETRALQVEAAVDQITSGGDESHFTTFRWHQDTDKEGKKMIPISDGVCFLTTLYGRLEGSGEGLSIWEVDGWWVFGGRSQQRGGMVQGEARCWRFPWN